MIKVIESSDMLEVEDQMPAMKRVLFLVLSLFPLLAPYQLVIVPDWKDYFSLAFLFVGIISAGALTVSAFLLWAAIAGLNSWMRFNKRDALFTYAAEAPVVRLHKQVCPLRSIQDLAIEVHDWTEGSPSYSFKVVMSDGEAFKVGAS